MKDSILDFIHKFNDDGSNTQVITLFTEKCCYWFARILEDRFRQQHPKIMYDQDMCHFGTEINGRVYDITGDVTDKYDWMSWMEMTFTDSLLADVVSRHCIDLEE